MPYNCPDRASLELATRNLQNHFNIVAKRYTSPGFDVLAQGIGKLENSYREQVKKKSSWFFKPEADPVRLEQINCIVLVLGDLQGAQASEEVKVKAHPVILGTLIYRYERILNDYNKCPALWGKADANSALLSCMKELLKISDMNSLDPLTKFTCCSAYRDYLKGNDGEMARRYSYIVNDVDYFENLQKIIDVAEEEGKAMNGQLQYILFIQSTHQVLLRYEQEVILTLNLFKEALSGKLQSSEHALEDEDIIACLPKAKEQVTTASLNLLRSFIPSVCSIADDGSLEEFIEDIAVKLGAFVHFGLLGAYILTLGRTEQTTHLSNVIRNATYLYGENVLDQQTKVAALTALSTFVESANDFSVSADAWQGIELFKSALGRQLIQSRVQPSSTSTSISTSTSTSSSTSSSSSSYSPSFSSI